MSRTKEDFLKLAEDFVEGRIFSISQMREEDLHLISVIFLPILFWKPDPDAPKVVEIFEYYSKAGPGGINGYPIFQSFQTLTQEECDILNAHIERYAAAKDILRDIMRS